MKQAFLSYAREDLRRATRLYNDLSRKLPIRIWFDRIDLLPGMQWEPAIRKAIRESDYFLAVLSHKAVSNRGFRHTELREALTVVNEFPVDSIFLIPIRLDRCRLPNKMRKFHYADLFPKRLDGLDLICRTLEKSVESGQPPAAPARPVKTGGVAREKSTTVKRSRRALLTGQAAAKPHSRYDVGLVVLGGGVPTIARIASGLNRAQSHFHFTSKRMRTPSQALRVIEHNPQLYIPRVPRSFYEGLDLLETDYVICLSNRLLAVKEGGYTYYNYLADQSTIDPRVFFISYSALNDYAEEAGVTLDSAIAYMITGELVDYFLKLGYHKQTRDCPMDFVDDHSKLAGGLRAGRFCRFCSKTLEKNRSLAKAFRAMIAWGR
jgi:hypothetical protein